MQVDDQNLGLALDLLRKGITNRTTAFWEAGIERILAHGENRTLGVPIGQYLMTGPKPVGVIFTIASTRRPGAAPPRTVVNLSTWYVEPEHRWRAPLMLKRIVGDPDRSYTSLTPTAAVEQILVALGFSALNDGTSIACIPVAAAGAVADCLVAGLEAVPHDALSVETRRFLEAQQRLGCIALAFRHADRWRPLLLKRRRLKGIPALRVIYSEDDRALHACITPICRHLIRYCRPLLIMDKPLGADAPGFAFPNRGRALMKGDRLAGKTDHSGSELVFFDF